MVVQIHSQREHIFQTHFQRQFRGTYPFDFSLEAITMISDSEGTRGSLKIKLGLMLHFEDISLESGMELEFSREIGGTKLATSYIFILSCLIQDKALLMDSMSLIHIALS